MAAIADGVKAAAVFDLDWREVVPVFHVAFVLRNLARVELAELLCVDPYQVDWYGQAVHCSINPFGRSAEL
jgi:hypothetical protein